MELAPATESGTSSGADGPGTALAVRREPAPASGAPGGPGGRTGALLALGGTWLATRALLVLLATGVLRMPGGDITTDVWLIYHGWYGVLQTGTFPLDDVTWQYPPGAALVIMLPGLLPWSYLVSFWVICGVADAVTMAVLVRTGVRKGRALTGAWVWVAGVPLLGPMIYNRYDVIVTAVAVAGLLALIRRPALGGLLLGLGGIVKIWPLLGLIGTPSGRRTRRAWTSAVAAAVSVGFLLAAGMNGAFEFLTFQKDRGVEVESVGALPLHFARIAGAWDGKVMMNYGSVEMLGPWVEVVGKVMMAGTLLGFGWLLLWRFTARRRNAATMYDAALAALLVFTVTSRVISPQYLVWLVGVAAVCLTVRGSSQRPVALLILAATPLTLVEFPLMFSKVVGSEPGAITVLALRNLLLLAAAVLSCVRLWRSTRGTLQLPATVVLERPEPVGAYPVRPGIAYEQDLLDGIDRPATTGERR
ncbi:glycosyltransferase family 87 protein [Kitasatospora sp. CM 4170]|uniref:Glycosyltransferase family 87 protein n=1 Tax=Kitasatospora aburaviensis TaxID=67265 RepID=A0ABW1EPW4_9ACTN|nr:glycosyltransferase family 87 protein [Kitasatospora sp. CM 4170]WNM45380.1 glycosyltransferase family 87 protein [Kitasatospora sp. CM 4170]